MSQRIPSRIPQASTICASIFSSHHFGRLAYRHTYHTDTDTPYHIVQWCASSKFAKRSEKKNVWFSVCHIFLHDMEGVCFVKNRWWPKFLFKFLIWFFHPLLPFVAEEENTCCVCSLTTSNDNDDDHKIDVNRQFFGCCDCQIAFRIRFESFVRYCVRSLSESLAFCEIFMCGHFFALIHGRMSTITTATTTINDENWHRNW